MIAMGLDEGAQDMLHNLRQMSACRGDHYPHATWRLLITPPLDGAANMAIDEAILTVLGEGDGLPTLRFFRWEPPCLSLGCNQHWQEIDKAVCRRLGYAWTRRPTGGKAILHADEFTYSLIMYRDDPRIHGDIVESYRVLSLGLLQGLALLGVQADQAEKKERPAHSNSNRTCPVCFDTPSHYEITWRGKKLIGSAQLRRRGVVLQHGTLPLCGSVNRILDVLAFSPEERVLQKELLPRRTTTLEQVLNRRCHFQEVLPAMAEGFCRQFNLTLQSLPSTEREYNLAGQLCVRRYVNDRWKKRI